MIKLGHTCAIADLTQLGFDYELNRINVPPAFRGRGYGSALMDMILTDADREKVTIRLWVNGQAGEMNEAQLRNWYGRLGWITNLDGSMVRPPKGHSRPTTEE